MMSRIWRKLVLEIKSSKTLHLMFLNWECYGKREIQGREEKSVEIVTCHGSQER